ncbi:MAG: hypothetical protein AAGD43_04535 [Pseudomonadota bacterium]
MIVRILASLKDLRSALIARVCGRHQNGKHRQFALDDHGRSFTDHVDAVSTENEWLRAHKQSARQKLTRSPKSSTSMPLSISEYDDYVEGFIDWTVSIGEAREQNAVEIMALARIFEAWSGWGRAQAKPLFRAFNKAGIKSHRFSLKPKDPRYIAAKRSKPKCKPHILIFDLSPELTEQRPTKLAA